MLLEIYADQQHSSLMYTVHLDDCYTKLVV